MNETLNETITFYSGEEDGPLDRRHKKTIILIKKKPTFNHFTCTCAVKYNFLE